MEAPRECAVGRLDDLGVGMAADLENGIRVALGAHVAPFLVALR
jgi:hypothetical protein